MNIVIIGATGGIGKCLSIELSKNNSLFLGSRNSDSISELINSEDTGSSVSGSSVDVTSFSQIENFLNQANDYLGSIDTIINCAGSLILKPAHLTSEEELEKTFKVNVFSCLGLLKYGFKFMRKNGGSFLFFSSAASKVGLKNHETISSAKGAISSMVVSAASTYARYNIRVNAIAPGLVDTPLTESIINNKLSLDYSLNLHGLKRIGKPENFIPIVKSLIDVKSDWITGQTISVDGGLSNIKSM